MIQNERGHPSGGKKQKQCKNERALNVYKNVPSSDLQKEKKTAK